MLAGCSLGPAYVPPTLDVPISFKNETTVEIKENCWTDLDCWWEVFEDEKLNELESFVIENNKDLLAAFQRIERARDLMGIAASQFYPQINLNPQYSNTGELIRNYINPSNKVLSALETGNQYFRAHELFFFFPLNLSYEVDLWGKIRDQYDSAKYQFFAQKNDYDNLMLTLTANLATYFYQIRTLDSQIETLLNILKTRQQALEINQARFNQQIVFYADVTLAEEEVETALIDYEESVRQRAVIENQIAILLGLPPSEFTIDPSPLSFNSPPEIPSGLPAEVLLRRPDIAEMENQLKSTHADVKAAYTLFFPSLELTTAGGFASPVFKEFLQWISRYWMLGAQGNQIAFDGFRTSYNFKEQVARFKELGFEYQNQVLVAFQEVEDALSNINSYATQYALNVKRAEFASKTYELYKDRYTHGLINYIDVTNTERDLLNFQLDVSQLEGLRYLATIQLIKALGGGW